MGIDSLLRIPNRKTNPNVLENKTFLLLDGEGAYVYPTFALSALHALMGYERERVSRRLFDSSKLKPAKLVFVR